MVTFENAQTVDTIPLPRVKRKQSLWRLWLRVLASSKVDEGFLGLCLVTILLKDTIASLLSDHQTQPREANVQCVY